MENIEEKIKKDEERLKEIKNQIEELMTDEKVLKYLGLQIEKNKLKTIILNNRKSLVENTQCKCNHELVYFISLYYKRLMYYPRFVCLECGKELNGLLKDNQMCVNENQIHETPEGAFGNYKDLAYVKNSYDELKQQELTQEEIYNSLKEKFNKRTNSKVKIVLKEETK